MYNCKRLCCARGSSLFTFLGPVQYTGASNLLDYTT